MSFQDEDLINEFVVESNEHLGDVENQLLEIESDGANINVDLVNTVFRAVHSVKGAAGFLGLETINSLAHSLENVLNKIRSQELVPTSASIDVMLKAADKLRFLVNNIDQEKSVDVSSHTAQLDKIHDGEFEEGAAQPESEVTPEQAVEPPQDTQEPSAEENEAAVPTAPEVAPVADSSPTETAPPAKAEEDNLKAEPEKKAAVSGGATPPPNKPVAEEPAATKTQVATPTESSIRVSVGVLDHLMNLAGELVLSRNQLMQAVTSREHATLDVAAAGLDHVTSELQETIMQTRMQPIGNVFGKFPRIVRDLSSKLGKQCHIDVEGKGVEVDKTIVEAIGDPLTHLIRNSVDHGIETPQERTAKGKNAEGRIQLIAFHQAGKVCIEIIDDGAGIDPAKLKKKAVEKGVITPERAAEMGDRDVVRLIFHPGFSTAEKISDVSGRGVGMDVVRTNIEKLGGNVDVESQVGSGTCIRVTLPLTLAIIPSMIVRCEGERFAVPQINILELVRLRADERETRIGTLKDAEVLRLRGALLPLVHLSEALQLPSQKDGNDSAPMNILVVEAGHARYGLVVDGLHDSEEIVVKPLGRHLKGCGYLAGATILGDGRVALILDVAGVASGANLEMTTEHKVSDVGEIDESVDQSNIQSLLLFQNNPDEHFAIPMDIVARIERVRSDQIDSVGNREILQYRGTSLPLVAVEKHVKAKPRPESSHLFVIVFMVGDREVGLIAPELNDIREVNANIDVDTFREPGIAGSAVIEERLTRLVDPFKLAQVDNPNWFERDEPQTRDAAEPSETRVLLAEDSSFFRKQVAGFFREEGYEVFEYPDGAEALTALQEDPTGFDIVVTDIEMPNMTGFQLCEEIRRDNKLKSLPVVALTSLSSEDDVRRGKEVGFDDYQVKMHRENLIRSVTELSRKVKTGSKSRKVPATV